MRHLIDNDVFFAAIYRRHVLHDVARRWLDAAKPAGWGVAAETYLAAIRLLMNPAVMKSGQMPVGDAIEVVETELAGPHPGRVIMARKRPDLSMLRQVQGHRQVMDSWLAQIAKEQGCRLATNDAALAVQWPDLVVRVS